MVDKMSIRKCLPGFQNIGFHMIFDIKMDFNFTRREIIVAGSHMTDPLSSITYSSTLYRNSVCIRFMLSGINDLDV